jgi:hypothetical protein
MAAKAHKTRTRGLAKPYEPAPHERAALEAYLARKKQAPLAPRLKVSDGDGVTKIAPDHLEPAIGQILLMEALGTTDPDFLDGLAAASKPPAASNLTSRSNGASRPASTCRCRFVHGG